MLESLEHLQQDQTWSKLWVMQHGVQYCPGFNIKSYDVCCNSIIVQLGKWCNDTVKFLLGTRLWDTQTLAYFSVKMLLFINCWVAEIGLAMHWCWCPPTLLCYSMLVTCDSHAQPRRTVIHSRPRLLHSFQRPIPPTLQSSHINPWKHGALPNMATTQPPCLASLPLANLVTLWGCLR